MNNLLKLISIVFLSCFLTSKAFSHSEESLKITSVEEYYDRLNIKPSGVKSYITIGNDSLGIQEQSLTSHGLMSVMSKGRNVSLIEIDQAALHAVGEVNHVKFKRCAGYFFHKNLQDAEAHLRRHEIMERQVALPVIQNTGRTQRTWNNGGNGGPNPPNVGPLKVDYTINQQTLVKSMLNQVEEIRIRSYINKLSSFKNRYYTSPTGVQAAQWIADEAKNLVSRRNDVTVELFKHPDWSQPSVIVTIQGTSKETIIIGGHLDSINSWGGGANGVAPGADDNASGISTWLEVLRVLVDNNYKPQKTIQFMGYAAEEVGLRGSNEIAKKYKASKIPVIGVVQLDMTNFKGAEKSIYLMTDYTNNNQNTFVGKLIDEYVKVPWGFDKCGYGCSDHASWHNQGFSASMPFEATMRGMNNNIHTTNDKIDISGGNAHHAVNFAKLALSFAIELDR